MSTQSSKPTPSKGFTCDCEDPDNPDTVFHEKSCWKVSKCDCGLRKDSHAHECCSCWMTKNLWYST